MTGEASWNRFRDMARKWPVIGTGIGIEIRAADLVVAVVRARPTGTRVLGALTIHNFREHPAAEWGGVYVSFIEKLDAGRLAAIAVFAPQ